METNNQTSRKTRRKASRKQARPSLKSGITKLIVFSIAIVIVFFLSQKQWLNSSSDQPVTTEVENHSTEVKGEEKATNKETDMEDGQENEEDTMNNEGTEEASDTTTSDSAPEEEENSNENNDQLTNADNETSETETEQTESQSNDEEEEEAEKVIIHVVQSKETLFKISQKYYGSRDGEQIIKDYNGLKDNTIIAGQKLKIPVKK